MVWYGPLLNLKKTSFMVLNNVTKFHIILIKNIGSLRAATVQLPHDPIRYVSRYCLTIWITIHFANWKTLEIIFDVRRNTQILTLVKLDVFMYVYYTLPQFLSNSSKIFQLFAYIYNQSQKLYILRSAGFSKVSWSCSTLFQNRIYQEFSMGK